MMHHVPQRGLTVLAVAGRGLNELLGVTAHADAGLLFCLSRCPRCSYEVRAMTARGRQI